MLPRITSDPTIDLILSLGGVFGWVVLLKIVYAAREGIAWRIRTVLRGVAGFFVGVIVAQAFKLQGSEAVLTAWIVAGLAAATAKRRSRHIPSRVRRQVIERDLRGQKYDPKKHHIDHVWPYSRGGSHAADNLRVLEKAANLKKGANMPRITDLF
jgi:hypothetical protein